MTKSEIIFKRIFDLFLSLFGLLFLGWFIFLCAFISFYFTKKNGFFKQKRVGQFGNLFYIYKIRTINLNSSENFNKYSRFLRKSKIDELPQLLNVLLGEMSFVGPRPDIIGFADQLKGDEKKILLLKPGITGPASIFFKNEEQLLNSQNNKIKYNREIIWPKKVSLNMKYIEEYSFKNDLLFLFKTILNL